MSTAVVVTLVDLIRKHRSRFDVAGVVVGDRVEGVVPVAVGRRVAEAAAPARGIERLGEAVAARRRRLHVDLDLLQPGVRAVLVRIARGVADREAGAGRELRRAGLRGRVLRVDGDVPGRAPGAGAAVLVARVDAPAIRAVRQIRARREVRRAQAGDVDLVRAGEVTAAEIGLDRIRDRVVRAGRVGGVAPVEGRRCIVRVRVVGR